MSENCCATGSHDERNNLFSCIYNGLMHKISLDDCCNTRHFAMCSLPTVYSDTENTKSNRNKILLDVVLRDIILSSKRLQTDLAYLQKKKDEQKVRPVAIILYFLLFCLRGVLIYWHELHNFLHNRHWRSWRPRQPGRVRWEALVWRRVGRNEPGYPPVVFGK